MDTYEINSAIEAVEQITDLDTVFTHGIRNSIHTLIKTAKESIDAEENTDFSSFEMQLDELEGVIEKAQCSLGDLENALSDVNYQFDDTRVLFNELKEGANK